MGGASVQAKTQWARFIKFRHTLISYSLCVDWTLYYIQPFWTRVTRKVLLIKSTGIFKVYRIFFYLYFYGVSFAKEWILRQLAGPPATQLELWTRWKWYLLPYWGDQKETRLVVVSLQVKKPGFFTMESLSFPIVTAGCGCISRLPLKVTASQIVLSTGWFMATKC